MAIQLAESCIYAALELPKLRNFEKNGSGKASVGSRWVEGGRLLNEALGTGVHLAVLFSDAVNDMKNLIYWALLTDIQVAEKGTNYGFERFSVLEKGHKTQHLVLKNSNRKIAPNYRRAYAICRTPDWLNKLVAM